MFWKRATGHGAFVGLVGGTLGAAIHHGLSLPRGGLPGVKGGWIATLHTYPSEMAQNFWTAIFAWSACFLLTIVISLITRPRSDGELTGLVWSLTERPNDVDLKWYHKPAVLATLVLFLVVVLNIIFW
jgi:SSS family solute:Na+ symporter